MHLEGEVEATEAMVLVAPRGRGRPHGPQVTVNLRPTAQRLNKLEDTVPNLSNMITQFFAAMMNAQAATARPLGLRTNSVGHEVQAPAQAAHGDQAAQCSRDSEAS